MAKKNLGPDEEKKKPSEEEAETPEEETEEEESAEKIEVEESALKAIADGVTARLNDKIDAEVAKRVDEEMKKIETVEKKNVNIHKSDDPAYPENESKELRFTRAVIAMALGNGSKLAEYNDLSRKARQKAGYGSVGTDADGGYLVEPEYEMAVEKLLPVYGVAAREATIVPVSGNTVYSNKLDTDIEFTEVGSEAGNVTGDKLVIGQASVALRKFMANIPFTSELNEDSAVDFYNEVVDAFARARAKKMDQLVFTDNDSSYPGIFEKSGVIIETVGDALSSITWDDLINAEHAIPTAAKANGKWYMHRTLWAVLLQTKDDEGRYQVVPTASPSTPWGSLVELCDILPEYQNVGSNSPAAVFGDLKRAKLYSKRGMSIDLLKEATINDADGSELKLALQDMLALRGRIRMVNMLKFPNAFCVLGTGTVS